VRVEQGADGETVEEPLAPRPPWRSVSWHKRSFRPCARRPVGP